MPSRCCVDGCKSNYDSHKKHVSVFMFPKDEEMRKKWVSVIPRKKLTLSSSTSVCALHFHDTDIIRSDSWSMPDGSVETFLLRRPKLVKTAVPSIFQNLTYSPKLDVANTSPKIKKLRPKKRTKVNASQGVSVVDSKNVAGTSRTYGTPSRKLPKAVQVKYENRSKKPVSNQGEKKPPAAKEKLRSALKAALTADNFDPLDLDNLLLSTASVFQEMCKELELSAMMNQQVDHLNVDKARITLTSVGGGEQALQIVNLNQIPEDPTPSFSESTNDLERMLTDAEKDLMSAEEDYPGTMGTRTMSTQTDDRSLEMENKKLKLENATLKNQILRLQSQIKLQDVSKLLVVRDDE